MCEELLLAAPSGCLACMLTSFQNACKLIQIKALRGVGFPLLCLFSPVVLAVVPLEKWGGVSLKWGGDL